MKYKIAIVMVLVLVSMLVIQPVDAVQASKFLNYPVDTNIYVNVYNNSGIEDGTVSHPYSTIQAGINAAFSHNVVGVAPGTYYENIVLKAGVRLVGTDPSTTVIDGRNAGVVVNMEDGSTLEGFTVQHGIGSFGAGIVTNGMPSITNNVIRNNTQTAGGAGAAIYGNCSSPSITRNLIVDNSSDSQFTSGAVSFVNCSSPIIASNVIKNNSGRGAINLTLPASQRATVVHNTIINNSGAGVKIDTRVDQSLVRVANNVFFENTTGIQIDFGPDANLPAIFNNDVFGNVTNYTGMSDITGENGNLSVAPQFSDNFHLAYGSPLVDTGSSNIYPFPDFDGDPRPLDGNFDDIATPDIGADERPNIDEIPPTISVSSVKEDGTPYIPGTWTNQTITVKFTCNDAESGIAFCPNEVVLNTEGITSEITGTARDNWGNEANISFGPIQVDKTPPSLSISVSPNPVVLNGDAELDKNATDNLSGVASLAFSTIDTSSVGLKSVFAFASDHAGNIAQSAATYQVIYGFDGFQSPVLDCTNNVCEGFDISPFKPGSRIPLKFQLKDANGNIIQAASAPLWLVPTSFDHLPTALPDDFEFQISNLTYEWRKNHQNYVYEWNTKGLPNPSIWLVGVKLDDGMTYHVFVALVK